MRRSLSEPFFLLDQCMSYRVASQVSRSTGYPITTVPNEWPDRNLSENPPEDWEIIPHLAAKASYRGLWITLDWGASGEHSHLIERHRISVLWLRGPSDNNRTLRRPQQARLLVAVMETVHRLVAESTAPVYLRARFDDELPILERLQGALPGTDEDWRRIPLD